MNTFVLRLLVNALALAAAAYVVDGIQLTGGFGSAVWVALVFGLVNAVLKPIVMLLSLPFLLVTLGLVHFQRTRHSYRGQIKQLQVSITIYSHRQLKGFIGVQLGFTATNLKVKLANSSAEISRSSGRW